MKLEKENLYFADFNGTNCNFFDSDGAGLCFNNPVFIINDKEIFFVLKETVGNVAVILLRDSIRRMYAVPSFRYQYFKKVE